jgi:hypothetical protein
MTNDNILQLGVLICMSMGAIGFVSFILSSIIRGADSEINGFEKGSLIVCFSGLVPFLFIMMYLAWSDQLHDY